MGIWLGPRSRAASIMLGLIVAALVTAATAGRADAALAPTYCYISPLDTATLDTSGSGTTTTDGAVLDGGTYTTTTVSGSCYDWGVSPAYTGPAYVDDAAAAAAEPPPPPIPTPTGLTWRNLYDWPNGHGYAGWHTASSAPAGAYGAQSALGGQSGLWLWPTGGTSYSYVNGNYVEWTYTAPGTTRISSAQVSLAYKNKLLAHHCIDVGLRTGSTIVYQNEHCEPVQPPDSQRQVNLTLADPAANPTAKTLYFRIRVDCGGATTCAKNIPQLDPLSTGGYARLLKVDMTLVDDDNPVLQRVSDDVDTFNDRYTVTVNATDAGSGVKSLQIARDGGSTFASANAPCDPTHKTPALDNRICPESFSLTGTLDISNLEDGDYTFVATATDLAGHVATLRWTVTIDRVSLDIGLNPLTATPRDAYTSATPTGYGATVTTRVLGSAQRQSYKWRVALSPGQTLQVLGDGTVAAVDPPDDEPVSDSTDPETDVDPVAPDEIGDGDPTTTEPDDLVDDSTGEPNDGTWVDVPDDADTNAAIADGDRLLGYLQGAQDQIDDVVEAVASPPVARDATGAAVPASYTVSGNVITLTIGHRAAPQIYPVTATADLVENPSEPSDGAPAQLQASAAANCPARTNVITYNPDGWSQLLDAFAANPTPCADYWITIPPPTQKKRGVRARTSDGRSIPAVIRALGTNFHPVAEFNWGAWSHVAPDDCQQHLHSCPGYWRQAGQKFRLEMARAGYDTTNGAAWALNEFPRALRTTSVVRANAAAALGALLRGLPPAPGKTALPGQARATRGITFLIEMPQSFTRLLCPDDCYKDHLRTLLQQSGFFSAAAKAIRFWGQETYARCQWSCVGTNLGKRAKETNAFIMHPWLLANAKDAPARVKTARAFFVPRYFPLLTGYWHGAKYGATTTLKLPEMKALVSLEVYSARRFSLYNRVPGGRIGFAWHNEPDTTGSQELANHLAAVVAAAYAPGGSPAGACNVAPDGCMVTLGPKFNTQWDSFRHWSLP